MYLPVQSCQEEQTVEALIRARQPVSRVRVVVTAGQGRGASAELPPGRPVGIGKSPDNPLQLDDMTVSRYHAELILRRAEVEVRDLDSLNGTYIGDVRVSRALVRPGAQLTIGANTILLTAEADGPRSSRAEPEE